MTESSEKHDGITYPAEFVHVDAQAEMDALAQSLGSLGRKCRREFEQRVIDAVFGTDAEKEGGA